MRTLRKYVVVAFVFALLGIASPSSADVNDFSFTSFEASYDLSINKAKDNRPEMWVTERLVANFPETDQNHGIRRSIPESSYGKYPGLINEKVAQLGSSAHHYYLKASQTSTRC